MRYQYACARPMLSAWNMPVPVPIPLILILIPDMSILPVFEAEGGRAWQVKNRSGCLVYPQKENSSDANKVV